VNLSKSGASVSLGRRGAWVTIGSRGTRTTVGLPGTGISYTKTLSPQPTAQPAEPDTEAESRAHPALGWLVMLAVVAGVVALARACTGQ
jgi:hypothetical protein